VVGPLGLGKAARPMQADQRRKDGIAAKQEPLRPAVFLRCHDERIVSCLPAVPAADLGCCR